MRKSRCSRDESSPERMAGMSIWFTIKRVVCAAYLALFTLSELYSAAAASLDRRSDFPVWEPVVGRCLFAAPALLMLGVCLLFSSRHRTAGFWLTVVSLGLYAAFYVFEQIEHRGNVVVPVVSFINAFWLGLFLLASLAALVLRNARN